MKKEIAIRRGLVLFLACLLTVGLLPQPARARVPDWQVSLLHPEEFFGEAEDIFYDSRDEETVYLFTVRKDPKEDLEDFADDLLKAEGMTLEKNRKTLGGDRKMELEYEGEDCVSIHWDKSEKLLTICYDEIVVSCRTDPEKMVYGYSTEDYPEQFLEAMLAIYESDYGLTAAEPYIRGNGDRIIEIGGRNRVRFDWYEDACLLELTYYNGWSKSEQQPEETAQEESQATDVSEAAEAAETIPAGPVDPYSVALPDPAAFLQTKDTQAVWGYTHYVTCLVDKSSETAVVEALRDLLLEPRYQLKERDTWTGTDSGKKCTYYSFEYTGKSSLVDWVQTTTGYTYHVRLTRMDYSSSQTAIILSSHPEFLLEDPGVTWEGQGGNSVDAGTVTPDSDYVNHTGVYILGIMKDFFGTPVKEVYNEDRYETNYYFKYGSYPDSAFKGLRGKMESLGLKCYQHSYSSNGGSKDLSAKAEGGSCLAATWRAKSGELQVTIKWEYVKKSGIFDSAEIPAEPAPAPDPNPEPGKIDCRDCDDGRCKTCGGDGELDGFMGGILGKQKDIETCKDCHAGRCKTCNGTGKVNG